MPSRSTAALSVVSKVLILALVALLAACAANRGPRPDGEPQTPPHATRWGLVEFLDATGQDAGGPISRGFWQRVRFRLSAACPEVVPRPGPRLAASWLRAQGNLMGADTLITGTLSGYRVQPTQVWLSLSLKVYQADTGRMRWAKRLAATVPLGPAGPDAALDRALTIVAREFIDAVEPSRF